MTQKMDIGAIGDNKLIFKKKFRWVCEVPKYDVQHFVRVSARPTLKSTVINEEGKQQWIPGKMTWESITFTFCYRCYPQNDDCQGQEARTNSYIIWNWLASVYEAKPTKKTDVLFHLCDGCGEKIESWMLKNALVQAINFGDHEEATVEVTLRYNEYLYEHFGIQKYPPELKKVTDESTGNYWLDLEIDKSPNSHLEKVDRMNVLRNYEAF